MIVRIQASGGSFLGAGKYYLHDKAEDASLDKHLKPETDERVWFTDTRYCLEQDPGRALEEMWRVAEDQAYLKMQAGVKRGGRVCEEPVKTMSLSWHRDDQPTPEHMIEAADTLMAHMGWDQHQALYVGHNDTEHRHIHIVLNRVNPETGRTLDDYREQKRSQEWALEYERSQDQVRCAQREINAAHQAEQARPRQQDAADTQTRDADVSREVMAERAPIETPAPAIGRAANDHLPHNVIMLARPHEQEFNAAEKAREAEGAAQLIEQRAELKEQQRAEREAFFKDGAKLFKATRHAVYDEVRQEYKAEWRQFYKDSDAAQKSAEASSETAVGRALHFARAGQWDAARDAFDNRDSVRDAVEKDLADRKADLKARQTEDLRERQRDACDALREIRDVQYQDLLQRQRDERADFKAGVTLEALSIGRHDHGAAKPIAELAANENRGAEIASEQRHIVRPSIEAGPAEIKPADPTRDDKSAAIVLSLEQAARTEDGRSIDLSAPSAQAQESSAPSHGVADLGAGAIGSLANVLADALGDLFAPTPPEVLAAQAKADAQRAAEREAAQPEKDREDKAAAYARIIDSAVRLSEIERAQQDDAYWRDRDRGKGWERDQ